MPLLPRATANAMLSRQPTFWLGTVGWQWRAWQRMTRLFWLKALSMTVFMFGFFALYFELLRHPVGAVFVMPLLPLDSALSYQPWAVLPYLSLWVYLGIAPGFMADLAALLRYALWNGLLCGLGLACFYFWPSAVPAFAHVNATQGLHALLLGVDAAGNACPSLHVATALFCGLWVDRLMREIGMPQVMRWAQAIWLVLIIYSTLAIKQHVVWDVLAGAALALAVAWLSLRAHGAVAPASQQNPLP